MTCTYTSPDNSDNDFVRALIDDTSLTSCVVPDETITGWFALYPGESYYVAALCARTLWLHYSKSDKTRKVGDVSYGKFEIAEYYKDLYKMLMDKSGHNSIIPYAGGISITDRDSVASESDRVQPRFEIGQFDIDKSDRDDDDEYR